MAVKRGHLLSSSSSQACSAGQVPGVGEGWEGDKQAMSVNITQGSTALHAYRRSSGGKLLGFTLKMRKVRPREACVCSIELGEPFKASSLSTILRHIRKGLSSPPGLWLS